MSSQHNMATRNTAVWLVSHLLLVLLWNRRKWHVTLSAESALWSLPTHTPVVSAKKFRMRILLVLSQ